MRVRARWTALAVAMTIVVVPAAAGATAQQAAPNPAPTTAPAAPHEGGDRVALPAPSAAQTQAAASAADPEATVPARPGATAAPVNPAATTLVQPGGQTFTATAWGDGFSHGYQDEAGYTVTRRSDGTWVYATGVDAAGDLVAS